jgi:outer membrane protein assembly factor BamB
MRLENGKRLGRIWQPVREPIDPVLLDRESGVLYFSALTDKRLYALDLAQDELLWEVKIENLQNDLTRSAKALFVRKGKRQLLKIDPDDGQVQKTVTLRETIAAGPFALDGHIYVLTETGRLQGYSSTLEPGLNLVLDTSPRPRGIAMADVLLIVDSQGSVQIFDAARGAVSYSESMPTAVYATPLLRDSTLFVAEAAGTVRKLDLSQGSEQWSYSTEALLNLPLQLMGDVLLVPDSRGRILALHTDTGELLWSLSLSGVIDVLVPLRNGLLVADDQRRLTLYRLAAP